MTHTPEAISKGNELIEMFLNINQTVDSPTATKCAIIHCKEIVDNQYLRGIKQGTPIIDEHESILNYLKSL